MDLWADGGTFCVPGGCSTGKEEIEDAAQEFAIVASFSCDIEDFFLPGLNKAAFRFSCFVVLKDNPSCVTDPFVGISVYEWNDAGELVRIEDFYSDEQYEESLAPCTRQQKEGGRYVSIQAATSSEAAISGIQKFGTGHSIPRGDQDMTRARIIKNLASLAVTVAAALVGFVVGRISLLSVMA